MLIEEHRCFSCVLVGDILDLFFRAKDLLGGQFDISIEAKLYLIFEQCSVL